MRVWRLKTSLGVLVLLAGLCVVSGLTTWKMFAFHARLVAIEDNQRWEQWLRSGGLYHSGQVLLFGDSQIARWPMAESFGDLPIWNRGLNGDLAEEADARFTQALQELRPALTVILIGTNDMGHRKPLAEAVDHIDGMLRQVEGHAILCSLLPASWEYAGNHPRLELVKWNAKLKEMAKRHGDRFVDLFAVLADDRGAFRSKLTDDGLHPNAAGYELMTQAILPQVIIAAR